MTPFDFVNRANADYIDRLYEQYQRDPRSLDEKWKAFFAGFDMAAVRGAPGPAGVAEATPPQAAPGEAASSGSHDIVHSYRELGHFVAKLDPLGHHRPSHPLLDLSEFGLAAADLDRQFGPGSFQGSTDGTLRGLIESLRSTYCGTLGVEFTNIADKVQREWLIARMEPILNQPKLSVAERKAIMFQLIAAEEFEKYLHTRYVGQKRFSLEGAIALIPLVNTLIEHGAELGAEKILTAMAHRGRLNVLAHVLNKPYEIILSEFEGTSLPQDSEGDGDVKYHLGYANKRPLDNGQIVKVSLLPNPSHLELIDPIMQGIVRAQQQIFGDPGRGRVMPIQMHGDAAFTGQGIVHETLSLSEIRGYRVGGTVHVIINNQIGFTTHPSEARFTPYSTDVAKMIQAPIFHVNNDDPEAVVHAAKLAVGFRQQFKVDVFVDLWCYRRHGHNETDEPSYTQPVMYREIDQHPSVRELYAQRLLTENVVTQQELNEMKSVVIERLESAMRLAKEVRPRQRVPKFGGVWKGMGKAGADWSADTRVPRDKLTKIAEAATRLPPDFTLHPKLKKFMTARLQQVTTGRGIDWGTAEMLALGSLVLEGTQIRFTGQDVERGTFSHRHAVLHDYITGRIYKPLDNLSENQAKFVILNTILSELAILGFEWGFASADPRNLVIWEAQFGDFVNGAQPIIDNILAAAESKWAYMNGIVMNLPHGYEGQGPEHSNAYLERFLALCAENNMQVANPTMPHQYFHLLRRQIHRKFRKPLVMTTPKSLLRFEPSTSRIEDFTDKSFEAVIDDPTQPERDKVRRVLMCSGKIYFPLASAREKEKVADVAIVRVEQLYPLPKKELQAILAKYRQAQEVSWVQEEPKNRGAWSFMEPRLRELLPDNVVLNYFGRDEAASPATGSFKMHQIEEQEVIGHALELNGHHPAAQAAAQSPAARGAERDAGF